MDEPKYKRVLLKISGEALAGEKHFGLDFGVMGRVADVIKECVEMGVQVGIVIGGGNFWRGVKNGEGYIERTRADHMGMLATAMNCMAMADVLEQKGVDVRVQTALEIKEVAEPYIRARPSGTWKRDGWLSSAAASAVPSSPRIPRRCCGRRRSARTLSCWPKISTAFITAIRPSLPMQRNSTLLPMTMCWLSICP